MKKYTIGEVIHDFSQMRIAVFVEGELKGSVVFCDVADEYRLKTIYANGDIHDDFYFKANPNVEAEHDRQLVFVDELTYEDMTDEQEVYDIVATSIRNITEAFMEQFNELSPEEQAETVREIGELLVDNSNK